MFFFGLGLLGFALPKFAFAPSPGVVRFVISAGLLAVSSLSFFLPFAVFFPSFWAHESLSLTGETKPTGHLPFGKVVGGRLPPIPPASLVAFTTCSTGLAHQCTEVLGTPVHWLAFFGPPVLLSSLARLTRFWFPPAPGPTGHQSGYWCTRLVLHQRTGMGAPVWRLVTPGWALDWPRRCLALRSLH